MHRIPRMIGEMLEKDPLILAGVVVVLVIVTAGVIIARVTKAKRMKKHAKFIGRRD